MTDVKNLQIKIKEVSAKITELKKESKNSNVLYRRN